MTGVMQKGFGQPYKKTSKVLETLEVWKFTYSPKFKT